MIENKLNFTIYKSHEQVINDLNNLERIFNSELDFSNELFQNKEFYLDYYKNLNLAKHYYNKINMQIVLQDLGLEELIDQKQFSKIIYKYNHFIKNMSVVERINLSAIKLFAFTNQNLAAINHINKQINLEKKQLLLYKELQEDIAEITSELKSINYLQLKMLLRKMNKTAQINGFDNFIHAKYVETNLIDKYKAITLHQTLSNVANNQVFAVETMQDQLNHIKKTGDFDFEAQEVTLVNIFKLTNANIYEVYEIINKRVIINDKFNKLLSDPKIDDVILYKKENTLNSYFELLAMFSSSIHNQFAKYFNSFENAIINEFEKDINFYFMLLISDIFLKQALEEKQVSNVVNQITKILVDTVKNGLNEVILMNALNQSSEYNNLITEQNKYQFENIFIDEENINFEAYASAICKTTELRKFIGLAIALQMFKKFDENEIYIEQIEKFYQLGNVKTTQENIQVLNIDLKNEFIFNDVIDFCKMRLKNDNR